MSVFLHSGGALWKTFVTTMGLCCVLVSLAGRGSAASPQARPLGIASGSPHLGSTFAIADFDGDSRPDLAIVQIGQITASQARYRINFELTAGERQLIDFTGPAGGLEIASRDVNGDHNMDLVVTTTWLSRPVAVLLNDGHGNFTYREAVNAPAMTWHFDAGWSADSQSIIDASAELPKSTSINRISFGFSIGRVLGRVAAPVSLIAINGSRFPFSGRGPPPLEVQV
jgi:hypothetical protein